MSDFAEPSVNSEQKAAPEIQVDMKLRHDDAVIANIPWEKYRSKVVRAVSQFRPQAEEPQSCEVQAPWGAETVLAGDYIASEVGDSSHQWRIAKDLFGPRLDEGTTELPDGATIEWMLVTVH